MVYNIINILIFFIDLPLDINIYQNNYEKKKKHLNSIQIF